MSFDHAIALIGCTIGIVGALLATLSFLYGVRKDRRANYQFKKEKVDELCDDLFKIIRQGVSGTYILGMSEQNSKQLKNRIRSTLQWHLLPGERSESDRQVGLLPFNHSGMKVNISEKMRYTTAKQSEGDVRCEDDLIAESSNWILFDS